MSSIIATCAVLNSPSDILNKSILKNLYQVAFAAYPVLKF